MSDASPYPPAGEAGAHPPVNDVGAHPPAGQASLQAPAGKADARPVGDATPAPGEPSGPPKRGLLSRRDALRLLGVVPLVPALAPLAPPGTVAGGAPPAAPGSGTGDADATGWTHPELAQVAERTAAPAVDALATPYAPRFFTPHEYATVRVLADMVIPADERSGSATDARVPEFMDFMMTDGSEAGRVAMRGGLAWLDEESRRRFGTTFVAASADQRGRILDDIAWPARAPATLSHGVAFFNRFRDLTAAGFFSSEIGHRDLGFQGNVPVLHWTGCGEAAERHVLGTGAGARTSPQR